jgi:hypothetical protein
MGTRGMCGGHQSVPAAWSVSPRPYRCEDEVATIVVADAYLRIRVGNYKTLRNGVIENARLLNELRQRTADLTDALEQQTATSQVLTVISSSPAELEPVFQAILANATRLCGAKFAGLSFYDGEALLTVGPRSLWFANPFLCSQHVCRHLSSRGGLLDIFETMRWGHFGQNRRQ